MTGTAVDDMACFMAVILTARTERWRIGGPHFLYKIYPINSPFGDYPYWIEGASLVAMR